MIDTPTYTERNHARNIRQTGEHTAPHGAAAALNAETRPDDRFFTMNPFRDARGVGRVWCTLVAYPVF